MLQATQLPSTATKTPTTDRTRNLLDTLKPWQIVALTLLISFLVFIIFDVTEQHLSPYAVPVSVRIIHFARGFLACASGMILVWSIMSRKDTEISHQKAIKQALLDEQADFLAVINHRLRNALLATDRIVKLMLNGDFGKLEPTQVTILEHVADNNAEVDRVIKMLVDIYEYRTGIKEVTSENFCIGEIVERVTKRLSDYAAAKMVSIKNLITHACSMTGDAKQLEVLIEHLLENAIKHARSAVSITCTPEEEFVTLAITDDGIGIADADLMMLFDRFYVSSKEGKYPAVTGVGLCLCAEIAKAHGGTLTCETKFGTGTTFLLRLRAA